MENLSPKAAELLRAGREALRPSQADRERILQALSPKVGTAAEGAASSGVGALQEIARGTLFKASLVVVGVGLAGTAVLLSPKAEPAPAVPVVAAASTPPAPELESEPRDEPPPAAEIPPAPSKPSVKGAPGTQRAEDKLAQEIAILSRAGAEIHAGRPATALKVLEEHRRRFPSGVMAQERSAARARALCMIGRGTEAQSELARLSKLSPNSPHEARARKACGDALTKKN